MALLTWPRSHFFSRTHYYCVVYKKMRTQQYLARVKPKIEEWTPNFVFFNHKYALYKSKIIYGGIFIESWLAEIHFRFYLFKKVPFFLCFDLWASFFSKICNLKSKILFFLITNMPYISLKLFMSEFVSNPGLQRSISDFIFSKKGNFYYVLNFEHHFFPKYAIWNPKCWFF